MSYDSLLVHDVAIFNPVSVGATDRYGNDVPSTVSSLEKALIQPRPGSENVIERDTRTVRYLMFFRRDSVVTGLSTVTWGTHEIQVDGEPRLHDYGTVPHLEADGVEYRG